MRIIILIWLLALIYCLLVPEAHAGSNFTNLSEKITYVSILPNWDENRFSDWSNGGHFQHSWDFGDKNSASSSIKDFITNPLEYIRRQILVDKINKIQARFEEAEKASQVGLSKERLREIEEQAIRVLAGATVFNHSEEIK